MAASGILDASYHRDLPPLRGMLLLAPAPPSPLVLPQKLKVQQVQAYESQGSVEWTIREILTGARGQRLYGGSGDFDMVVRNSLAGSAGAKRGWPEVGMAERVTLAVRSDGASGDIVGIGESQEKIRLRVLVARGDKIETAERVGTETVEALRANGFEVKFRVLEPEEVDPDGGAPTGHLLPLEAPEAVAAELAGLLDDIEEAGVMTER